MVGLSDDMQAEVDALLNGKPKLDVSALMSNIQEIFARNGSKKAQHRLMMSRINDSLSAKDQFLADLRATGAMADICSRCGQAVVGVNDAWCDSEGSVRCGGFGFQMHTVRNQENTL